jgi:hypothetical protein
MSGKGLECKAVWGGEKTIKVRALKTNASLAASSLGL